MLRYFEASCDQLVAYMNMFKKIKNNGFLKVLWAQEDRIEAKLSHLGAKLEYFVPCWG